MFQILANNIEWSKYLHKIRIWLFNAKISIVSSYSLPGMMLIFQSTFQFRLRSYYAAPYHRRPT